MKKKDKKKIEEKITKDLNETIKFLDSASAEEVYKYFEEKNKFYFELKDKIIIKLLKKKDKLIHLALAKFSYNCDIPNYLYETSKNQGIRLAAITNENRFISMYCHLGGNYNVKKMHLFLKNASSKELEVFFSFKKFSEFLIETFLDKKPPFDKISKKKYIEILNYLDKNPNIKEKDMKDFGNDGYYWHTNQKVSEKFKFVKLRNSF
jgi:hypothetical protein